MKKGLFALVLAFGSLNVMAEPITLDFEGFVNVLYQPGLNPDNTKNPTDYMDNGHVQLAVGDTVTGSLVFDVDNINYTQERYNLSIDYTINIGGLTWEETGNYYLAQNQPGSNAVDVFWVNEDQHTSPYDTTGVQLGYLSSIFNVNDLDAMLAGDDFQLVNNPADGIPPSHGTMTFGPDQTFWQACLVFTDMKQPSSEVSEPGTIALLSFGLLGLVASRRRKA